MKKLTKNNFELIRATIMRQARPLAAASFHYHFENGSAEDFSALLSLYQNADGGFGHALEPDLWTPASTPYATLHAATQLMMHGLTKPDEPILEGVLRYFHSGAGFSNGEWQFTLPCNNDAPHAPWWSFSQETNEAENSALNASISAFLLHVLKPDDPLYDSAIAIARQAYDRMMSDAPSGEMFLDACLALIPHWLRLSVISDPQNAFARLGGLVHQAINHSREEWSGYVPRPSRYIFSPESPFAAANQPLIDQELDYLIDTLKDGLWPITWTWGDNSQKYPDAFAMMKNWAGATFAIGNLCYIRAFGRLE